MARLILSGGTVVLPDAVVEPASVVIEGDTIVAVERRAYPALDNAHEQIVDVSGRLVLPGLVDLHNDGLESEINPRPGVNLPLAFALANIDRQLAGTGVTTEFHAVFFANMTRKERRLDEAATRAREILAFGQSGRSLVDHQVLFRLDLWTPESLEQILATVDLAAIPLVSLNDHTPGQGQYRDVTHFKRFYREALGKSDQETDEEIQAQVEFAQERLRITRSLHPPVDVDSNHLRFQGLFRPDHLIGFAKAFCLDPQQSAGCDEPRPYIRPRALQAGREEPVGFGDPAALKFDRGSEVEGNPLVAGLWPIDANERRRFREMT